VVTTGYVNGAPRTQLELLHGLDRVALGGGAARASSRAARPRGLCFCQRRAGLHRVFVASAPQRTPGPGCGHCWYCPVCSGCSVWAPLSASRTDAHGAPRAGLSTAEQLHLAERINTHVSRLTGQAPPALPSAAELEAQAARADADLDFGDGPRGRRRFGTFSRRRGAWGDSDGFDDD